MVACSMYFPSPSSRENIGGLTQKHKLDVTTYQACDKSLSLCKMEAFNLVISEHNQLLLKKNNQHMCGKISVKFQDLPKRRQTDQHFVRLSRQLSKLYIKERVVSPLTRVSFNVLNSKTK